MLDLVSQPRTMPQSEESERAVLAAVLLDPRLLPSVSGRLTAEDFYGDRHRAIYAAMLELQEESTAIDLRTLQARLEQRGSFEAAGGLAYLNRLDEDLPDLGRFENYVEIVKERSVRRRLIDVCREVTRDCLDGGVDAASALSRAEQSVMALGEEAIHRGFVPIGRVAEETLEMLEEHSGKGIVGLDTGFVDLNARIHGLSGGSLVIVAGRPGMGKTTFAMNVAMYVASALKKTVGVFSLEMSKQELALRLLSAETEIGLGKLRSAHLSQNESVAVLQAMSGFGKTPMFIDDSASPSLLEIASKARRLLAEKKLSLLIIDYLQLMQVSGRFENRNLEISAITRALKQLAKELDIPVMLLSQLSRMPERRGSDHRPQLSDLRESGAIEQDADVVLFVYRDWVYKKDDPDADADEREAELIISKNRHGAVGTVPLVFFGEYCRFRSRAEQGFEAPFE